MIGRDGVLFLTITKGDRLSIATSIERLIDLLDELDGDADLEIDGDDEDGRDDEPSFGWTDQEARFAVFPQSGDEREVEDDEPDLGWIERDGQGPRLRGRFADPDEAESVDGLAFDGTGNAEARRLLAARLPRHFGAVGKSEVVIQRLAGHTI